MSCPASVCNPEVNDTQKSGPILWGRIVWGHGKALNVRDRLRAITSLMYRASGTAFMKCAHAYEHDLSQADTQRYCGKYRTVFFGPDQVRSVNRSAS